MTDICVDLDESLGSIIPRILSISFQKHAPHSSSFLYIIHRFTRMNLQSIFYVFTPFAVNICINVEKLQKWGGWGGDTEALTVLEASFM